MAAIVHDKIKVRVLEGDKALTVDQAKQLLGWQEENGKKEFSDYLFKDTNGKKVRLTNNQTNRPFRAELAVRYAKEQLRGKWALNGETLVFDRHGKTQSGQHRLVGLVLAEQIRLSNEKYWKEVWGQKGPITIEAIIVEGISEKPEVVDTLDIGQKRSLGDVLFRNHTFADKDLTDKDCKKLANILAHATRLVWLRQGGKAVSDAPHFPHSEALELIEDHPRLVEAVQSIYREDGTGAEGSKIASYLSLGYAAGLLYLMAISKTDREAYDDSGELDDSNWDKAEKFWVLFASGANLKEGSPILALRQALLKIDAGGAMGRDEIIGTVAKAFAYYMDGDKSVAAKDIRVKKGKDEGGKPILTESPRIGGIDVEIELPAEPDPATKANAAWKAGDTAWADTQDGVWFGTIVKINKGKREATLTADEDGQQYAVPVSCLSAEKPEAAEVA